MLSQGEKREMRRETSQHAVVSRTNQGARERGETSIFIGRVWNVKIVLKFSSSAVLAVVSRKLERDGRTDPDAAGLTAIEQWFHWFDS